MDELILIIAFEKLSLHLLCAVTMAKFAKTLRAAA